MYARMLMCVMWYVSACVSNETNIDYTQQLNSNWCSKKSKSMADCNFIIVQASSYVYFSKEKLRFDRINKSLFDFAKN